MEKIKWIFMAYANNYTLQIAFPLMMFVHIDFGHWAANELILFSVIYLSLFKGESALNKLTEFLNEFN